MPDPVDGQETCNDRGDRREGEERESRTSRRREEGGDEHERNRDQPLLPGEDVCRKQVRRIREPVETIAEQRGVEEV